MSRCFPFPPPGYEKKPRPEEDLFQEEKGREKKHKKEKKSKRKREGEYKEDGNKDRVKQKEKKNKKDKHRDTKEEKMKTKDKDKRSISDDATTAGQPETSGTDNTHTREEHSNSKSHGFSENKFASAFRGRNGFSISDSRLVRESEESKFVQELGRRIKDEVKAIGSQTIQRSSTSDRRMYEEMHRSVVTCPQNSAKDTECVNNQGVDPKKVEGKGTKKVEGKGLKDQFNGSNPVQNLTVSIDRKVEMASEPVQKVIGRPVQKEDKCKEKSDSKRGEKRKDREKKEKKSHGKDKGRDTIKKKEKDAGKKREETEKERTEYKIRDQDRSKHLYGHEHSSSSKNINVYSSQVDNKIVSTEENVKKRKDVEANGFGHENEIQSDKLRTNLPMNNGTILEACRSPCLLDSNRLCIPLQDTVGARYQELNGTVGPQSSYMPKQNPPSEPRTKSDRPIEAVEKPLLADEVVEKSRELPQAPVVVKASIEGPLGGEVIETSRRSPQASRIVDTLNKHPRADRITEPSRKALHPDLKDLREVLSEPKIEVWSEVDDQEWLFSKKDLPLEEQKSDVSVDDSKQPHVWSETLHIESADIYALPYVIPY